MSSTFLIASISAGAAFAVLDLARKKLAGAVAPAVIIIWLMFTGCLFFGTWLVLDPRPAPESGYWGPAAISIALNAVANLLFLRAVFISPLSRTIPFLSLSPAFAALSAWVVVNESLALLQWAGITLVVVGALLINLGAEAGGPVSAAWAALRKEKGSVLMIGTAFCWGIAAPFDKMAVLRTSIPVHAFCMEAGVGVILLVFLTLRNELHNLLRFQGRFAWLLCAMLVAIVAFSLQLIAYREGFVGLAETIKRVIGMISSLSLGYFLFREKVGRGQVAAVSLMCGGVGLLLA